jgi:hypothetical protein
LRAARPRATRSHDPPSLITGGAVAGPRRLSWRSAAHPPPPPTPPPRYQKFYSLTRGGGAYRSLLSPDDEASLPLLSAFQRLAVYKRVEMPPEALTGRALTDHYDGLIAKYIGRDRLYF